MTKAQRWTMLATILGTSMVFLDGTIVNLALPHIGRELPASLVSTLEGQTYVVGGYLAILAALLLLAGTLADFYGRRRVFAIGLCAFGITSVLCGLAPTLELLVLARLLQGAAAALLVPGSLAIITATFHDEAVRSRAIGIWAAAASATALIGPLVGGLLVDTVTWRAAFLINVPLVCLALYATVRHVEESRAGDATAHFDWLGAAVAILAVGGLAFGAIRGQEQNWHDPLAWAALAVGVVALVAFPILMARRPHPLIPLSLFRRRRFATINLSTFLIYGAAYTMGYLFGLFLQNVLGYTATAAGLIGIPTSLLIALFSARVGARSGRIGSRPFLIAGPMLMAAGLLWLSRIPATSEPWRFVPGDPATYLPPPSTLTDLLPYILLWGAGFVLVVAPLTATLMSSIPGKNAATGSAINNSISRVGQPLLSAVIFVAVTGTFYTALAGAVPGVDAADPTLRAQVQPLNPPAAGTPADVAAAAKDASVGAFHLAVAVCATLLVLGAVANAVGLGARPADEEPEPADEEPGLADEVAHA